MLSGKVLSAYDATVILQTVVTFSHIYIYIINKVYLLKLPLSYDLIHNASGLVRV